MHPGIAGGLAVLAFAIALVLDLAGIGKGRVNENTFVIVGLLCLAIALVTYWGPWRGRTAP
jgi:hypothetical protein